ncbi:3-phenylpropionate MFS transporter [Emcibacter sp.]|uniref:3-phenylpropionate MFS transporter n=1 Tax=Emcibacter sp. TaxID=1979954 RepID=UPI002AA77541|nr:3-phenylpropionate MFS transporter [Emcibacter sp.]
MMHSPGDLDRPASRQKRERRSASIRLGSVYGVLFLYVGVMLPFWGLWLQYKGLTPVEIGMVMTVPYLMKPIIPLISTQLADRFGRVKVIFLINLVLTLLFFTPYLYVDDFGSILLVTVVLNLFFQSLMPLLETMSVAQARKCGMHYGRVRSTGSVTFIISAILIGLLIKGSDPEWVVASAVACLAGTLLAALRLPSDEPESVADEEEDTDIYRRKPLKRLLKDRRFILFMIVVALIQMSHGIYYTLGSIHWKNNGISADMIGMLWGTGVMAEVLVFIFASGLIARNRPTYVFTVIAALGVLRWLVTGASLSLPLLFLVQIIHGLTYGAAHLAAIYYIANRVPRSASSTAQGLYSAFPMGIAQGLTTVSAGLFYTYWQGKSYWIMALLCLIAVLVAKKMRSIPSS